MRGRALRVRRGPRPHVGAATCLPVRTAAWDVLGSAPGNLEAHRPHCSVGAQTLPPSHQGAALQAEGKAGVHGDGHGELLCEQHQLGPRLQYLGAIRKITCMSPVRPGVQNSSGGSWATCPGRLCSFPLHRTHPVPWMKGRFYGAGQSREQREGTSAACGPTAGGPGRRAGWRPGAQVLRSRECRKGSVLLSTSYRRTDRLGNSGKQVLDHTQISMP